MSHARVVNVRAKGATWDVYIGRGRCPATGELGEWGNPWRVDRHGAMAIKLYLDGLAERAPVEIFATIRRKLAGKVLGCWCAPRPCHGEILARLADGESLDVIRLDMLRAVGLVPPLTNGPRSSPTAPPDASSNQGKLFSS